MKQIFRPKEHTSVIFFCYTQRHPNKARYLRDSDEFEYLINLERNNEFSSGHSSTQRRIWLIVWNPSYVNWKPADCESWFCVYLANKEEKKGEWNFFQLKRSINETVGVYPIPQTQSFLWHASCPFATRSKLCFQEDYARAEWACPHTKLKWALMERRMMIKRTKSERIESRFRVRGWDVYRSITIWKLWNRLTVAFIGITKVFVLISYLTWKAAWL